jgi:hypothetical protein
MTLTIYALALVQPRIKAPRSSLSFTEAIIVNLLRKAKSVPSRGAVKILASRGPPAEAWLRSNNRPNRISIRVFSSIVNLKRDVSRYRLSASAICPSPLDAATQTRAARASALGERLHKVHWCPPQRATLNKVGQRARRRPGNPMTVSAVRTQRAPW